MKLPARIITTAWGRPYVDTLLSLALPAVLAPGNLPSLTKVLDCELVLVTEEAFFGDIRKSPVFRRMQQHCPVRLVMLDDLIAPKGRYGMTLTYALHRGLADLGKAMTDHYLIFLNADFILADGSFRVLADRILAGAQLIHAPSYCVIQEDVELMLHAHVDRDRQTLVLLPREMAEIILAHRHYTIRGKTVNQRVFHSAYIDQFYWQVDDHTLLGRQMPVSLVCMKPERVVTEMRTFWDYGVVAEFCPTIKPCVLGDSDEFLMLELRDNEAMFDWMHLGWPLANDIAATLAKFVTDDQKNMGRWPLVLHSRDLPKSVEVDQERLNEFVQSVYRHMPERAVPHLDHPFWVGHYAKFQAERARYLADPEIISHLRSEHDGRAEEPSPPVALTRPPETTSTPSTSSGGFLQRLRSRLVGQIPFVRRLHPFYTILRPTYELLEQELSRPGRRILIVADHDGPMAKLVRSLSARGHLVYDASALLRLNATESEALTVAVGRYGPFDLLLCEVTAAGLPRCQGVFETVRSIMARPGRVIVFHLDGAMKGLTTSSRQVIRQAIVPVGRSEIFFSGSLWAGSALRLLASAARIRARYGRVGILGFAVLAAASVALSAAASSLASKKGPQTSPHGWLSMTLDYELPAFPPNS